MMLMLESEEALVRRMLPEHNQDHSDRAAAWNDWQSQFGESTIRRYVRIKNYTSEPDEDIFQNAIIAAYQRVENGQYQQYPGIPFTAFVKGIVKNKIREAQRRSKAHVPLDDVKYALKITPSQQPEAIYEHEEVRSRLKQELGLLPKGRRQVLERYIRGDRTNEIASALSMTEAAVRQHKCRGVRRLKERILMSSPQ